MSKQWIELNNVFARDTAEECNRQRYDTKTSVDAQIIKQSKLVDIMLEIQRKEAMKNGKPSILDTNGRKREETVAQEMTRLKNLAEQIYAERMQAQQGMQPQ